MAVTIKGFASDWSVPEPAKSGLETALGGVFATLDAQGRQPVRKGELVVSVKDYGATGNGVTDDEAAILDTVAAVSAAGGGTVYFPVGKYIFHHLLIVADNVTLRGDGWNSILAPTYLHTDNIQAVRMVGNNVAVRDLFIQVQNPYMAPQAGFNNYEVLRIGGPNDAFRSGARVENVKFYKGGGCNAYRTDKVVIRNCEYVGSHGNSFGSVSVRSDVLIQGNTATDGNDDLIAVTCDANVPGGTKRVVVTGNVLARTDAKAICTSGVASSVISGNHCEDTRGPAVQVFQDSHFGLEGSYKVNITGNIVIRGGKWFGTDPAVHMHTEPHQAPHGIHIAGPDITVAGNSVFDSHGRGVQADEVTRFRISGNTIDGAGMVGINLGNVDDTNTARNQDGTINGNLITRTVSGIAVGAVSRVDVAGNRVSAFKSGSTGETRGIYYGYVKDSTIHDNPVINTDGANYAVRARPSSINEQTTLWNNASIVPGAGTPGGEILSLGRRITFGAAAPTSGLWRQGDVVINDTPASGSAPWAWICRADGTPGTWTAQAAVNLMGNTNTWSGVQNFNNSLKLGSSSTHTIGFYGATGSAKQALTYSKTGETAAEAQIRGVLVALGLVTDSTTA